MGVKSSLAMFLLDAMMNVVMILFITFFALLSFYWFIRFYTHQKKKAKTIAFFHPYSNAGGGGELVLWEMISTFHKKFPSWQIIIYSGDTDVNEMQMLAKARQRFEIDLPDDSIELVKLRCRGAVEAKYYPVLTLFFQFLGGAFLAIEAALSSGTPEVFCDSMGYPLSLPVFKYLANCEHVTAYVHYPFISTDMIESTANGESRVHTSTSIASKWKMLRAGKVYYYRLLSYLYGLAGRCCDMVIVNSCWTQAHIASLWHCEPTVIYPPCGVEKIAFDATKQKAENLLVEEKEFRIISLAQFRPEKNHILQIDVLSDLIDKLKLDGSSLKPVLVLIGGCRNANDYNLVENLKKYANQKKVGLTFKLNIAYEELIDEFDKALIGIHTMVDEHFGIAIIESIAAGLMMVMHNSGGPKQDINGKAHVGDLARRSAEYVDIIYEIICRKSAHERTELRRKYRQLVDEHFDKRHFSENILQCFKPFMHL